MTLREVSVATGLTPGFLSQLERGRTNVSIRNLKRLADHYGTPLRGLFEDPSPGVYVTREDRRADLNGGLDDVVIESLTPAGSSRLGAVLVRAAPARQGVAMPRHEADELTIVLDGEIDYLVGDDEYRLARGDAVFHAAGPYHHWRNARADKGAVLVIVSSPATL